MAKVLTNTKSSDYLGDKEVFLKELKQFHDSNRSHFRLPVVNGREIDLYLLYLLVTQRGGFYKVNNQGHWDSFLRPLRLPTSCLNGASMLRRIYAHYLERYERARGPPTRDDDYSADVDDDIRKSSRGTTVRASHSQGFSRAAAEALRGGPSRVASPSERLALSLLSPLPNEQDFAVNVCTVLTSDASNGLPLSTTPHILDFLLAHAGVYNYASLRDTIGRSYAEARGRPPDDFWRLRSSTTATGVGGALELADERRFASNIPSLEPIDNASEGGALAAQALAAEIALNKRLTVGGDTDTHLDTDAAKVDEISETAFKKAEEVVEKEYDVYAGLTEENWAVSTEDEEGLFAPELMGGARCTYTQRVLQIATIVRNLSFHEENLPYMARHTTLIRFVLLCANSLVGTLQQSGLDTLGNISQELIIKDPSTCLISRHILSVVFDALVSTNRSRVLAALELLNKLSQNEANEDIMLRCLEPKVYEAVCGLLTLRDIMGLVSALECVCALTALGERACERVARVKGLVHTLVSLITVEAQSYGPKACILMRVVETVSGAPTTEHVMPQQAANTAPAQGSSQASRGEATSVARLSTPVPPRTPPPALPSSVLPLVPAPAPAAIPVPAPSPIPTLTPLPTPAISNPPPLTVHSQHIHQQTIQENEHFALAWLRAAWELASNVSCEASEIYRQYLACCSKVGRKGVIAPLHFPRLVRTVFGGTVGPNSSPGPNGETIQVYTGIRTRLVVATSRTPPVPASGPASPILKAQLTSKAEQQLLLQQAKQMIGTQPQAQSVSQPSSQPHPHLTQALEQGTPAGSSGASASTSGSNFIKHLLAHKVTPAFASTSASKHNNESMRQVTQRQNQQRMMGQQGQCSTPSVATIQQPMEVDAESQIKSNTITLAPNSTAGQNNNQAEKVITITVTPQSVIQQQAMEESPSLIIKDDLDNNVVSEDGSGLANMKAAQNKMLADLLEKKSSPPVPNIAVAAMETDHAYICEPPNKKAKLDPKDECRDGQVSSTAANLYAALAASALEDEEDLIPSNTNLTLKTSGNTIHIEETVEPTPQSISVQQSEPTSVITQMQPKMIQQGTIQIQQPSMQVQMQVQQPNMQVQASMQVQQQTMQIQQPIMQVQQPVIQMQQQTMQLQQQTMQLQQPTMQLQQPTMQLQQPTMQLQQPTMQLQQPVLQMQQMDMQMPQMIQVSQSGQLIIQEKPIVSQQTQYIQQQPMQIITNANTSQGGIGYIQGNMLQQHKTIIIVQQAGSNTPITLTVNNSGALDENTLSSLIAQASEAITQQQQQQQQQLQTQTHTQPQHILQKTSVIQGPQRKVQPSSNIRLGQTNVIRKPTPAKNQSQLSQSQQPIITNQPQPHKPTVSVQQNQPNQMMQKQNQQSVINNPQILSNQQLVSGQQIVVSGSQIMSGNPQIVTHNQVMQAQQIVTVSGQQQILMSPGHVNSGMRVVSTQQMVGPSRGQTTLMQHQQANISYTPNNQQTTQPDTKTIQGTQKIIQKTVQHAQNRQVAVAGRGNKNQVSNAEKPPTQQGQAQPKPGQSQQKQGQQTQVQPMQGQKIQGQLKQGQQIQGPGQPQSQPIPAGANQETVRAASPKPEPSSSSRDPWICHWLGCGRRLESPGAVFGHAARDHCTAGETPCMWHDCDRVPRRRFALMNHLHDRHCTPDALRSMAASAASRRVGAAEDARTSASYPPNAALAALNKHAADILNPRDIMLRAEAARAMEQSVQQTQDDNEGPVTKSIRLTAAIILRNIVIYSNTARRQLRCYEHHLSSIALSSVEASRTIAQVLHDMHNI